MKRRFFTLLVLAALAASALAPVAVAAGPGFSQIYVDWGEGPAQYLFTKADRETWEKVSDDDEAERFIRLFWARRDPTPDSSENEFRREFERRVVFADQRFGEGEDEEAVRGAMTDRGRAFILLGPPRRLQTPGAGGAGTGGDFGSGGDTFGSGGTVSSGGGPGAFGRGGTTERFGVASEEIWIYEGAARPDFIEKRRLRVTFRTKPGTDEVEIFHGEEAMGYMGKAIELAVVNPDVTLESLAPSAAGLTTAEGDADYGLYGADLLADEAALADLRAALSEDAEPSLDADLAAGAFQASDGRWIVPVQVSTEGTPPPAGSAVVGELAAAGGESKVAFRFVPDEWKSSRGQSYVKATVTAQPGEYELHTGLQAPSGELLWSDSEAIEVPADQDSFWISEVVLSESIFPMQEAQQMLEPWAWQGIAVVPEGDRTFAQGGVLWYYLHACQPQLDENGKPKLRLSMQLTGAAKFRGPAQADPVKAGDNCWVVAQAYDIEPDRFPPGEYEMRVTVRDSVAGTTLLSAPVSFQVIAEGG